MRRHLILFLASALFLLSCERKIYFAKDYRNWKEIKVTDSADVLQSIYLIGDVGKPFSKEINLNNLTFLLDKDSNSSVIFLGDNVYPKGLPLPGHKDRAEAEKILDRQLDAVKNYKGNIFFIPGNHDWEYMGKEGWARVRQQEAYIESRLNRQHAFIPGGGCPGPVKISISDELVIIVLDTQWWLHDHNKPYGGGYGCKAVNKADVLVQLRDFIDRNKGRHIVVAAHHPLFSNGNHGGYHNALDHIFPLRLLDKYKWYSYIPLPLIGSLYPLYRKFGGSDQDLPSYEYQHLKKELMTIFRDYKEIIYVAGHEHNLQYYNEENFHHIISGSGCKVNPLKAGGDVAFADKEHGFAKLVFYNNGEAWVEFYESDDNYQGPRLAFRTLLYKKFEVYPESYCGLSEIDYKDSTVTARASQQYHASKFSKRLLGEHYRKDWSTLVQAPILDLQTEKGGLIPYSLGGGKQSLSLKFKNPDDQEYVARTIEKDPKLGAVPEDFINTVVDDLVQDQISSQQPFGAVTIPPLADAARVLHTRPEIKYIPGDSCLGPYLDKFSNTLVLFEEDPDEAHKDAPHLGNAEEIIGTDRVIEKLEEDNDNRVDQYAFARARILDMFIGDWDRHKGQYRWAESEHEGKGKTYLPVPEDHDQAYFRFDGIIPYLVSRPWGVRSLQHFDDEFSDIKGLNLSGRLIDRRFANSLTKAEWKAVADTLVRSFTDSVIELAIKKLPPPIFALSGEHIIKTLKSRRNKLPGAVEDYYEILATNVDVYGSDKHELFLVERINENETKVTVYKEKKSGEVKKPVYERIFATKETNEIRLYGLGGEDDFRITGKVKDGIVVRMVGGEGNDTISDFSEVAGLRRHTVVYDTDSLTALHKSRETKNRMNNKPDINDPDQDNFFYNYKGPIASVTYNQGDGFFIGLGATFRNYKFRANPYGVRHKFLVSYAAATQSFKINYAGDFRRAIGNKDLQLNIDAFLPYFAMNYFGYGNDSPEKTRDMDFYRVKMTYMNVNPMFIKRIRTFLEGGIGPKYEYFKLEKHEFSIIDQDVLPTDEDIYEPGNYAGLRSYFKLGNADHKLNPTRGIILSGNAFANQQLDGPRRFYTHMESDLVFYLTPNLPRQLTFAARIGAARSDGDFKFYQASALGGVNYLRGYYKTRFVGDKSFWQNIEVRAELTKINLYILAGRLGATVFLDNGRVWPGGGSYHQGYGGGLWINLANRFIVNTNYGFSDETSRFLFNFGYFF